MDLQSVKITAWHHGRREYEGLLGGFVRPSAHQGRSRHYQYPFELLERVLPRPGARVAGYVAWSDGKTFEFGEQASLGRGLQDLERHIRQVSPQGNTKPVLHVRGVAEGEAAPEVRPCMVDFNAARLRVFNTSADGVAAFGRHVTVAELARQHGETGPRVPSFEDLCRYTNATNGKTTSTEFEASLGRRSWLLTDEGTWRLFLMEAREALRDESPWVEAHTDESDVIAVVPKGISSDRMDWNVTPQSRPRSRAVTVDVDLTLQGLARSPTPTSPPQTPVAVDDLTIDLDTTSISATPFLTPFSTATGGAGTTPTSNLGSSPGSSRAQAIDLSLDNDDDEEEEEDSDTERDIRRDFPAMQRLYQVDTMPPEVVPAVAKLLTTTPEDLLSGNFTLKGMKTPLSTAQVALIWRTVDPDRSTVDGDLIADGVSLGKTRSGLCLIVLGMLVRKCKEDIDERPELHMGEGSRVCRRGNVFGFHCVCDPASAMFAFARKVNSGPALVVPPAVVVQTWVREIGNSVAHEILVPAPDCPATGRRQERLPFLTGAYHDSKGWHKCLGPDGVEALSIVANAKAEIWRPDGADDARCLAGADKATAKTLSEQYHGQEKIRLSLGDDGARRGTAGQIIVMSAETLRTKAAAGSIGVEFTVERKVRGRMFRGEQTYRKFRDQVRLPLAMAPSAVVFDECHKVHATNSLTFERLQGLQRLARSADGGGGVAQFYFLSATPLKGDPRQLAMALRLANPRHPELVKMEQTLSDLSLKYRRLQRRVATSGPDTDRSGPDETACDFTTEFFDFVSPWMVARMQGVSPVNGEVIPLRVSRWTRRTEAITVSNQNDQRLRLLENSLRREIGAFDDGDDDGVRPSQVTKCGSWQSMLTCSVMPEAASILPPNVVDGDRLRVSEVEKEVEKDENKISKLWSTSRGAQWARALSDIVTEITRKPGNGRPRHILIAAQTALMCAMITEHLQRDPKTRNSVTVKRLSSKGESADKRDAAIAKFGEAARRVDNTRTFVIVTTPALMDTGINTATFMSCFVQVGELQDPTVSTQLKGRIDRISQAEDEMLEFVIKSSHPVQDVIRARNRFRESTLFGHKLAATDGRR